MENITMKDAIAYFQSGKGEWCGKSDFGRQSVEIFLACCERLSFDKKEPLSDKEEDRLIGVLEQINAPSAGFSLEELFRLAWFLEYLNQKGAISQSIDPVLSQIDDLARNFTVNVNYRFNHFINISPYLLLRYENDKMSETIKKRLQHTMLLQLGMLDAFTSSGRMEDISPYIEELTIRYCPDNILIKCLCVLYDYHRLYIFPARTTRLINMLLAVIFEAYDNILPENRAMIDHLINKLVELPFWTDKEISERLTGNSTAKPNQEYPAFKIADSMLYMSTYDCYYFPVFKI